MELQEHEHIALARKKVRNKKRFIRHFSVFLVVNLFFFFMNMATGGEVWFIFPTMVWGVPLAIHYLFVYGLPFTKAGTREWEEKQLEKELEKLRPLLPKPQKKGFSIDEHLELKEFTAQPSDAVKEAAYRDDLV
ncbi:MAG: 2TM domain-containing protein [Saprospiraceae bacterium]